jgi:hypothetical protein
LFDCSGSGGGRRGAIDWIGQENEGAEGGGERYFTAAYYNGLELSNTSFKHFGDQEELKESVIQSLN